MSRHISTRGAKEVAGWFFEVKLREIGPGHFIYPSPYKMSTFLVSAWCLYYKVPMPTKSWLELHSRRILPGIKWRIQLEKPHVQYLLGEQNYGQIQTKSAKSRTQTGTV